MASSSEFKGKQEGFSRDSVKKVLNKSAKLLCDNLRLDNILLTLLVEDVLTRNDVTKIKKKDTNSEKVEALLDILALSPVSSYQVFMRALEEERPGLYKEVKDIEDKEQRSHLCQEVKTIQEETSDTSEFDLERCKQEIIDFYMISMSRVNLLPWFDEETRDMDDIYVTLELENNGEVLDRNDSLVTIRMSNGTLANRLLVKGTVGSGKSTLMAKLAYTWAQRNPSSPLYNYDLVFILSLREIQKGCSIIDAIFQQIMADNTRVSKVALNKYISSNPSQVLFLLDGFDEYFPINVDIVYGEIDGILNYRTFRETCVIVSSRPHKHLGKCRSFYMPVTLKGFSDENVKIYLSKFFCYNSNLVEGLYRKLSDSEKLESLSHIPIMLLLMCLLWEDSQTLPNKQSELYAEFTQFLWKKFCHKYNTNDPDDDDSLKNFLVSLGRVAFDGLMSEEHMGQEKLVFSEADFLEDLEHVCQVGLLTKERQRSKLKVSNAVTFLHKSFQEYCSSFYWASLPDDQFDSVLQRIDTIEQVENKLEILLYLCGAGDTDHVVRTIHHVIQVYMAQITDDDSIHTDMFDDIKSIHPVLTLLLESNFPSGNVHLTESLRSLLSAGKELYIDCNPLWLSFVKSPLAPALNKVNSIKVDDYDISPAKIDILSETLLSTTNVDAVKTTLRMAKECNADDLADSMGGLGKCIGRLKKLSTLELIFDIYDNITPIIHAMSTHCEFQLQCMQFNSHNFVRDTICDANILCNLIANQHQLCTLSLIGTLKLYNGTTASVLDAIKAPLCDLAIYDMHIGDAIGHIKHIIPNLHSLHLRKTGLEENDILTLGEMLPNAKHLSTLALSWNHVGTAIHTLSCVIHQLKELNLGGAHLDENDILTLSGFMNKAKCLSHLNLSGNHVGKTIHTLSCVIHQLKELNLGGAHLDENDILTLSGFMNEAKCLSHLNLSFNKVGRAAGKLGESLKSCSNLKLLKVKCTGLTEEDVIALRGHLRNVEIESWE